MSFEQPAALWLLLALLLLLLVRRPPPRRHLHVANLHLWTGLESRQTSALSHRFRQHRPLLLQAGFIACVVIALARPHLAWMNRDVVVIIDVSMSMGARQASASRLDTAKARAVSIVRSLPFGAEAHVFLAGTTVERLGEFSANDSSLERALEAVRAIDASTDLEGALQQVRGAVADAARIYVLSDAPGAPQTREVTWEAFGEPVRNIAITTVAAERDVRNAGVTLLVGLWNYSDAGSVGDLIVSNGQTLLGRQHLQLPGRSGTSAVFRIPPVTGVISASVAADDGLEADNVRYAVMNEPESARAVLVGRNHFVEQALAALPHLRLQSSPGDAAADVVICAGCDALPSEYRHINALLIPPAIETIEPAQLVVTADSHAVLEQVPASGAVVAPTRTAGELAAADVLARAGGLPVIAAYQRAGQRTVELRFDPERSIATGEPMFPLLIAQSIAWLHPRASLEVDAGTPLRLSSATHVTRVSGPDGRSLEYHTAGNDIVISNLATAGVYRVTTPEGEIEFAVNPATRKESNVAALVSPNAVTTATVVSMGDVTGVARLLLVLALAFLALEWKARKAGQAQ